MTMRKRRPAVFGPFPALALAVAVGACTHVASAAYTEPGWYLEKPHLLIATAPQIYGGPYSYEECEAERTKLPRTTADQMLCFRHLARPAWTGPYLTDWDMRGKKAPEQPGPQPVTAAPQQ